VNDKDNVRSVALGSDHSCFKQKETLRRLLETLQPGPEVGGALALLRLFGSVPSLTLIAVYPLEAPVPPWDLFYPESSELLQLVVITLNGAL